MEVEKVIPQNKMISPGSSPNTKKQVSGQSNGPSAFNS